MRQSVAAAKRARLRLHASLVQQGVLDDKYFEGDGGGPAGRPDADGDSGDELLRPEPRRPAPAEGDGRAGEGDDPGASAESRLQREALQAQQAYDEDELLRLQREDRSDVPLEPFNLEEEKQMGHFDGEGGFVWRRRDLDIGRDDDEEAWLRDGAPMAHDAARRPAKRSREDALQQQQQRSREAWVQALVKRLGPGEDAIKALKRLRDDREAVLALTEAASQLLAAMPEVYSTPREDLDALIAAERRRRMDARFYEYRMSLAPGSAVHGPFSASMMDAWRAQGYFDGDTPVFVRESAGPAAEADGEGDQGPSQGAAKRPKAALADDLAADFDEEDEDGDDAADGGANAGQAGADGHSAPTSDGAEWRPSREVDFSDVFE